MLLLICYLFLLSSLVREEMYVRGMCYFDCFRERGAVVFFFLLIVYVIILEGNDYF